MRSVLIAAGFSLILSILLTPLAIWAFRRQGLGQEIRDDGPESHLSKKGTPTMGGTVIVGATVGGYVIAHLFLSDQDNWGFTATGVARIDMTSAKAPAMRTDFTRPSPRTAGRPRAAPARRRGWP